ncbi:MAG: type II toxin-antitoxin system HipA family toxin [Lacunisphaera sp.]|nr:type II toxin-antitoxin system HipA family toxin [Lacunisphaera sp.]
MPKSTHLVIWMNGARVGVWAQPRAGSPSFQYDPAWVSSEAARVLSLSLPFTPGNAPHRGETVTHFFDNLLPDSDGIRARLQAKFATDSTGAFDLLTAIGRDCVGAVQLLPEGAPPQGYDRVEAEPLDDAGVEQAIGAALTGGRVLGQADEDDFRISIAGAQEKTALLYYRNRWCRPKGSTPTTHILKLPLGLAGNLQADMQDSVENEWLCSRLMEAFDLETAHCEIAQFGERKVLVVQRFDRAWEEGRWIARLPQEDFCQALGQPARLKYEADGGPGMSAILRVLATSSRAEQDKRAFAKAQMVYWLLAATDGHAKNFSLFHERGGTYRLTPFYDVLSAWPIIGNGPRLLQWQKAKLAMAVRSRNAHWKLKDIVPRHWDAVARLAGLGDAAALIAEVLRQTPAAIAETSRQLPRGFPARVSDRIFAGMQEQAKRLAGGP